MGLVSVLYHVRDCPGALGADWPVSGLPACGSWAEPVWGWPQAGPVGGRPPPLGASAHDDEVELSLITDSEQTPPLVAS